MRYLLNTSGTAVIPVTRISVKRTREVAVVDPETQEETTTVEEYTEVIENPTDEQVDAEEGKGYPLAYDQEPEYDADTHKTVSYLALENGAITRKVNVVELTKAEKIAKVQKAIAIADSNYVALTETPILYTNTHTYKPSWVSMYYIPVLAYGVFPRNIDSADTVIPTSMTKAELEALVVFLNGKVDEFLTDYHTAVDPLYVELTTLAQQE